MLSYCRRKAFNEVYDKINEFSNFKHNLVFRFNKLQDTATELGSKDTFLRTQNSLLNYNRSLNMKFNSFLSVIPQSNSKTIQIFQLVNMVNHSGLPLSNVLHKYFILNLLFVSEILLRCKFDKNLINKTLSSQGSVANIRVSNIGLIKIYNIFQLVSPPN